MAQNKHEENQSGYDRGGALSGHEHMHRTSRAKHDRRNNDVRFERLVPVKSAEWLLGNSRRRCGAVGVGLGGGGLAALLQDLPKQLLGVLPGHAPVHLDAV